MRPAQPTHYNLDRSPMGDYRGIVMAKTKKTAPTKKAPKKTAPAKKSPTKNASKAKRYTPEEKAEILGFVESEGRGGQSKASKKFGVSALTISNWRKKAGGSVAKSSPKVSKKAVKSNDPWKQMVALKSDIDHMERKLEVKKTELRKLAAEL